MESAAIRSACTGKDRRISTMHAPVLIIASKQNIHTYDIPSTPTFITAHYQVKGKSNSGF